MKILFLDQSGQLGGAELCLADLAQCYRDRCLVALFSDGPFATLLQHHQIPVQVLAGKAIQVRKDSGIGQSVASLGTLLPLIHQVAKIASAYDLIYANTQKALVVGAIASLLSRRPLIYHLHDILSPEHFSHFNRCLAVTLANRFAAQVIANSEATRRAFWNMGGRSDLAEVVYNGFNPGLYSVPQAKRDQMRQELDLGDHFVVGHFSRLSPWKGQHVLLKALQYCSEDTMALFIGDDLFGERDYADHLHDQAITLGLTDRVQFLGFRSDIPPLMAACDLVVHSSTMPEPFGRVVVEAMLSGRPVIAAEAGGVTELLEHGKTGWMSPPEDAPRLAELIMACHRQPEQTAAIAHAGQRQAHQRFDLSVTNQQIDHLLQRAINTP